MNHRDESHFDQPTSSGTKMYARKSLKAYKQEIRKRLIEFKNSSEAEMHLEPMPSDLRRETHILARKMGLCSLSHGKEPFRYMTIKPNSVFRSSYSATSLTLPDEKMENIRLLTETYPVERQHIEDHFSLPGKARKLNKKGLLDKKRHVPPPPRMTPNMQNFRRTLPTFSLRNEILKTIDNHKVTLITGGTGCGKTTQVPQFLIEQASAMGTSVRIMCTQPRRLPAVAVAKRVAVERGEELGSTVGYHIRLEPKTSEETVLTYCTSGVLLRMLATDPLASDITHIILDEVHEREKNTDYLLMALKYALRKRHDLKIILMSATMEGNMHIFLNYFDSTPVGRINVTTRLFSVDRFDLVDVLALTGYMPKSVFGCGMFSANTSSPTKQDSFPPIGEFRSDARNGKKSPELHTIRTEPNLSNYHSTDLIWGGNPSHLFNNCGSLSSMNRTEFYPNIDRECDTPESAMRHLNQVLPNLPPYFEPNVVPRLRSAELNRTSLVQAYRNAGGYQWEESIDVDLTARLIRYITMGNVDGAILVFLPGYEDMMKMHGKITESMEDLKGMFTVFILHSQISSYDQQRIFEKLPNGQRKIILSTNIAEASLTIDDVVFVVDCGKVKEMSYCHQTGITELKAMTIAKSNAEQRAGRAGRCRNGYCFRMYTKEEFDKMNNSQVPEMKRIAIHEVCLHAKMFAPEGMPVKAFLAMAPDPPLPEAVDYSLQFLERIGALYSDEGNEGVGNTNGAEYFLDSSASSRFGPDTEPKLTELGRVIAQLPLDPQLSRLLLFGIALKCFSPVVTLVASLSHRDPFVLPAPENRAKYTLARDRFGRYDFSDHLMLIRAAYAYSQHSHRPNGFCRLNFLNPQGMKMIVGIRGQLILELRRLKFLPAHVSTHNHPDVNLYSNCWPMIQAAIVAGCYPFIGQPTSSSMRKIRVNNMNATVHPSSVIKRQMLPPAKRSDVINEHARDTPVIEFMAIQELSQMEHSLTIKMVTIVPPLTVLLFAGPIRMSKHILESFEITEEDVPAELLKVEKDWSKYDMWGDRIVIRPASSYHNSTNDSGKTNGIMGKNDQKADTQTLIIVEREGELLPSSPRRTTVDHPIRTSSKSTSAPTLSIGESLLLRSQNAKFQSENVVEDSSIGRLAATKRLSTSTPSAEKSSGTSLDRDFLANGDGFVDDDDDDYAEEYDDIYNYPGCTRGDEPIPQYAVKLDENLRFDGTFNTMKALMRVRFKLMDYFLAFLKNPLRTCTSEDMQTLKCVYELVTCSHEMKSFNPCDDLPVMPANVTSFPRVINDPDPNLRPNSLDDLAAALQKENLEESETNREQNAAPAESSENDGIVLTPPPGFEDRVPNSTRNSPTEEVQAEFNNMGNNYNSNNKNKHRYNNNHKNSNNGHWRNGGESRGRGNGRHGGRRWNRDNNSNNGTADDGDAGRHYGPNNYKPQPQQLTPRFDGYELPPQDPPQNWSGNANGTVDAPPGFYRHIDESSRQPEGVRRSWRRSNWRGGSGGGANGQGSWRRFGGPQIN